MQTHQILLKRVLLWYSLACQRLPFAYSDVISAFPTLFGLLVSQKEVSLTTGQPIINQQDAEAYRAYNLPPKLPNLKMQAHLKQWRAWSSYWQWLDRQAVNPCHKSLLVFLLLWWEDKSTVMWYQFLPRVPPMRSRIPVTTKPEASSTAIYLPPGRMFARLSIWLRVSPRISRIRFWSLLNQYWQTLNSVGSIVVNDFEYLQEMMI